MGKNTLLLHKAQDFVTGIKYAADNKSQALWFDSKTQSRVWMIMWQVQILTFQMLVLKAVDDYTVQYTLTDQNHSGILRL